MKSRRQVNPWSLSDSRDCVPSIRRFVARFALLDALSKENAQLRIAPQLQADIDGLKKERAALAADVDDWLDAFIALKEWLATLDAQRAQ